MRASGSTRMPMAGVTDQRLVDSARPGHALQCLHHLAEADGQAVKGKLRPCGKRIRRERALAPRGIGDVVVRLLDRRPREEGRGGLGVLRHLDAERWDRRRAAGSMRARWTGSLFHGSPTWLSSQTFSKRVVGGGLRGVDAHAERLAGRNTARSLVGRAAAESAALHAGFIGPERDQVQAREGRQAPTETVRSSRPVRNSRLAFACASRLLAADFRAEVERLPVDRRELASDARRRRGTGIWIQTV